MTAAPARLLTADEFFCLPNDGKTYELVEGRLEAVGGASPRSSAVAMAIGAMLYLYVRQHKLGVVGGADWGTRLFADPDTVRNPDVCFVRADRLPGGRVPIRFQEGAPDLVVEVLSPTDRYRLTQRKVRDYLTAGVRLLWLVDPADRSVLIYRADGSITEVEADGTLDGEDIVPGFTLDLAEIWVAGDEADAL